MSNNTLETRETKKTFIFIDGLKSNTSYELKVFIKTHVGYNSAHYLFTNFTTKIGCKFILYCKNYTFKSCF